MTTAELRPIAIHNIRMTVTDLTRSSAFYEDVLGFEVLAEFPSIPDDRRHGDVIFQTTDMLFGMRPTAQGAGHLGFSMDSIDGLRYVSERLDESEIDHDEIFLLPEYGVAVLAFNDPDGFLLELTAPL